VVTKVDIHPQRVKGLRAMQSDGTEAAWNDIAGWNENTQPMKWNLLTSNIHNTSTKEMFEYNAGLTLQDFF